MVPDDAPAAPMVPPTSAYVSDQSFKIVAYYAAFRDPDSIDVQKFKMITHLNFAFIVPNPDGSLKPRTALELERFKKVMDLARQNGVKTAISLGGPEAVYSGMAASPAVRRIFVNNVVRFVLANNLDGVDLDWEYPRADKANNITYSALVKEMTDTLHVWHKFVSAAVTPAFYAGNVRNGISPEAIQELDFFNIMTYDGIGTDPVSPGHHSTFNFTEKSLDIWLTQKGLPKSKAVLGIPAYGKNAANTAMTFRDLLYAGANAQENQFQVSEGNIFYYNGLPLVKQKTLLAKEKANGVMLWEFYQDANGSNSILKAINEALGRSF